MVPIVLVVDDDERARRLVRMGLELEGMAVVEAESLERAKTVIHHDMSGVVLDRHLPDGDGLDLLPVIGEVCPDANVVIHSTTNDGRAPDWLPKVDKGDLPAIVEALDLSGAPVGEGAPRLAVVDLVRAEAEQVAADWEELCRWDPLLPPDNQPPLARLVVDAIADALQRPQPLGWGPDPALSQVTELFANSAGAIDVAVGQLICLRETFRRHLAGHVPAGEEAESQARVDMIIDRAIWSATRVAAARLERQLHVDALTGLPNRRAFDRDADRELKRSLRYGRPLSIVIADVPTGDAADDIAVESEAQVRRAATMLAMNVRGQDTVYRTGPASFMIVVPDTDSSSVTVLLDRLRRMRLAGVTAGAASFPQDGADLVSLIDEAERRRLSASV